MTPASPDIWLFEHDEGRDEWVEARRADVKSVSRVIETAGGIWSKRLGVPP